MFCARHVTVHEVIWEISLQRIWLNSFDVYRSTAFECNIKYALSKQQWRSGYVQVQYWSYNYYWASPWDTCQKICLPWGHYISILQVSFSESLIIHLVKQRKSQAWRSIGYPIISIDFDEFTSLFTL